MRREGWGREGPLGPLWCFFIPSCPLPGGIGEVFGEVTRTHSLGWPPSLLASCLYTLDKMASLLFILRSVRGHFNSAFFKAQSL